MAKSDIYWQLEDIREEFRKLIGRRSTHQLSNEDCNIRINRFLTQRLPAILDLKDLESTIQIHTRENTEVYDLPYSAYTIRGPAYVNGTEMEIIRDINHFYDLYPQLFQTRESIGSGNGVLTSFSGTLSKTPISYRKFVIDDDNETFRLSENDSITEINITDITQASPAEVTTEDNHNLNSGTIVQILDVLGMDEINGIETSISVTSPTKFTLTGIDSTEFSEYVSGGSVTPESVLYIEGDRGGSGTVTVSSGAFSLTFNSAPSDGQDIRANYEFYNTGIPVVSLLYGSELYLSPIPNGTYLVEIPIVGRPAPLINDTDRLPFDDWGYLVAYGSAIDHLNAEAQQEQAQMLMPIFQQHIDSARYRDIKNEFGEISIPRF